LPQTLTYIVVRRQAMAQWYEEYLIKEAMQKDAIWETLRALGKGLKQTFIGGRNLTAPPGMFLPERQQAVQSGNALMEALSKGGVKVHRARVKSPSSIAAKGLTAVPDDLLGMQVYGYGPQNVQDILKKLQEAGVSGVKASGKVRPGYHGINIKGTYGGTPMEMQVSPGRMSNLGQMMEHTLGYKAPTEAPRSNVIDKWVGKRVAPAMVSKSWIPQAKPQLQQMGVAF
jgi:hypothetical protein